MTQVHRCSDRSGWEGPLITLSILITAVVFGAPSSARAPDFGALARKACTAPVGSKPMLPGIKVIAVPAVKDDLPYLRITDSRTGGTMNAYYDSASARSAWARAACLGAQIRLTDEQTGSRWKNARWFAVTFTRDLNYIPPRSDSEHRWTIATEANGSLGTAGQTMLAVTMPHEQVHAFQMRSGTKLPRWLEEGHAEWVSRKVKSILTPEAAASDARGYEEALAAATTPLALAQWGGITVSREAILRQASQEDRRRMEAGPAYVPPGPFKIGPKDMVSDESNLMARYAGAYHVFSRLEKRFGAQAVSQWTADLTANQAKVDLACALASARATFGIDLSAELE